MKKSLLLLFIVTSILTFSFTVEHSFKQESCAYQDKESVLPEDYFGSWLRDGCEMPCDAMFTFNITKVEDGITLSNGTEFGGYDVQVIDNENYYQLNFEQRAEGESSDASILVKLIKGNLHVAWDGGSNEWTKYTKCPQ